MGAKDQNLRLSVGYMTKFFWILFATIICVPSAVAGTWVHGQVASIVGLPNGGINVLMSPSLSGCVSQAGYGPAYASLLPSNLGKDRIATLILAAYMSNKPISLYFGDSTCTISEVELGYPRQS
jgi:energy-converting hydrogenase Eha subunit B